MQEMPRAAKVGKHWEDIYKTGEYARKHPTWHVEDSQGKATLILQMLNRNHLAPKNICEIGCGAGAILKQLQDRMDKACEFWGYEISPQAYELSQPRANDRLHFALRDIRQVKDISFDLILLIDLLEHVEDYFDLLRDVRTKSTYKVLNIPLEISVQAVLRTTPFRTARADFGHIHFFTKETALAILADVGYEVMDYFYAPQSAGPSPSLKARVARPLARLFFAVQKDFVARLMGGFSLVVLARTAG